MELKQWIKRGRELEGGKEKIAAIASGKYEGCFRQYNVFTRVPRFRLSVDGEKLSGHGYDAIGEYTLKGEIAGQYVALKKKYVLGTGNRKENKGHTVYMKLKYCEIAAGNPAAKQALEQHSGRVQPKFWFMGTWRVSTSNYVGDGSTYFWQVSTTRAAETDTAAEITPADKMLPVAQVVVN
jgi:hypothetical protein